MLHANFCLQLLLDCLISFVAALSASLEICVVLILSGTPINPPHSLLVRYFLTSFDKCVFVDRLPCFSKEQIADCDIRCNQ